MIRFDLRNLLRNSILLILILAANKLFAQQDTVVVYEYIYKTDTVWLESKHARDTIVIEKLQNIEDAMLIIDTITEKTELVIFSSSGRATIPINRIILSKNQQKKKSLKRVTFMGLTFFPISSYSFAKSKPAKDIGIFFKGNIETQTTNYKLESNNINLISYSKIHRLTSAVGVKGNFSISPFLSLSPRISFTQIKGAYRVINHNEADSSLTNYSEPKFYFFSTDLLLNYYLLKGENSKGRIYGGLRADCLIGKENGIDLTNSEYANYRSTIINCVGGIGFDFGKRIYAELEYSNNINKFIDTDHINIKYTTVSINVGYHLF
jgi:hypothetical protein